MRRYGFKATDGSGVTWTDRTADAEGTDILRNLETDGGTWTVTRDGSPFAKVSGGVTQILETV